MYEAVKKITDSELKVMQVLWVAGIPLTAAQVKGPLIKTTKWNGDTIKTLLRRLCQKGAVSQKKHEILLLQSAGVICTVQQIQNPDLNQ